MARLRIDDLALRKPCASRPTAAAARGSIRLTITSQSGWHGPLVGTAVALVGDRSDLE